MKWTRRCTELNATGYSARSISPNEGQMKTRLLAAALAAVALTGCNSSPTGSAVDAPAHYDGSARDPLPAAGTTSSDSTARGPNTFGSGN